MESNDWRNFMLGQNLGLCLVVKKVQENLRIFLIFKIRKMFLKKKLNVDMAL